MSDAFISYSRLDKEFVGKLREALADKGKDVWIDWESIPASQLWWQEIRKGIAKANNFVLIMSPNSMASPICHMEIEYAREVGKRIIPVVYADYDRKASLMSIAERLATDEETVTRAIWGTRQAPDLYNANLAAIKPINYFYFKADEDFPARFDELFKIIDSDPVYKEKHTTLGLRAAEWDRRGRDASFLLLGIELTDAEQWRKDAATGKEPPPTVLQMEYISASRKVSTRRRNITISGVLIATAALVFAVGASIVGVNAVNQADTAQQDAKNARTQVAIAGATLSPVPPTLTAVASALADAKVAQLIGIQVANASLLITDKQNSSALEIGNALVKSYPDKAQAYVGRGLINANINKAEDALTDYNKALKLDSNYVDAYINRGRTYNGLKEYDKALADFNVVLNLDPNNISALTNRGTTYFGQENLELAILDYTRAVVLDPNNANAFYNRGIVYNKVGRYSEALADFFKALELDPNYIYIYVNLGITYNNLQQYTNALDTFNTALELDPILAPVYFNRGDTYFHQGEYDKAVIEYSKALELNPNDAVTYFHLGNADYRLKKFDNAITDLTRAIELDPQNVDAYIFRGAVHYSSNQYAAAIADWDKAKELGGKLPDDFQQFRDSLQATLTAMPPVTIMPTATAAK